ncbi:hypothetical protein AVEN_151181-2-1, partial [Araneus ventricosus]
TSYVGETRILIPLQLTLLTKQCTSRSTSDGHDNRVIYKDEILTYHAERFDNVKKGKVSLGHLPSPGTLTWSPRQNRTNVNAETDENWR